MQTLYGYVNPLLRVESFIEDMARRKNDAFHTLFRPFVALGIICRAGGDTCALWRLAHEL
jgi:hypothetical protein